MQASQANSTPYKKTSILLNDIGSKVPKLDSTKFQKKHSCSQISPHNNIPNPWTCGLPTINTVVSTSNLSTASFSFTEEIIRRIARQEVIMLHQEVNKSNYKFQNQIQKLETNIDTIKKSTKKSLEQNSVNIQKQTSDKLQIILGGIKKAMIEVLKQVISLPVYENKRYKQISEKVNKISEHVFKVPYQRQKPSEIANQMKEITKQIQVFSQCNMTLFSQLNKIKSTVTSLSAAKPSRPSSNLSSSSTRSFRPRSSTPQNLQFKNKTLNKSKSSLKQSQDKPDKMVSVKVSPVISFSNIPSVINLSLNQNNLKSKDEMNQNSFMYQVDTQGKLLDSHGNYLLTEQGQYILVEQEHINQLRKFNMLVE